jgi:tetratricopeptide repeat protein 8
MKSTLLHAKAVWYLKLRALTLKNWIDDTEIEEEGIADVLLDENETAQVARPGTSLARPMTQSSGGPNQSVRPMTGSGRPITGFARPGTSSRNTTSASGRGGTAMSVEAAMKGSKPGASRPVTSSGRFVRLGTASMISEVGGPFINVERLDLRKYASRSMLARALCDYIVYNDHNMKKALELCALATQGNDFHDWWWKARLGKCYYQLGLLRDAERQFASSLKNQEMITTVQELCKIYLRMDQPNAALEQYNVALKTHQGDANLMLGVARVYDALNDSEKALQFYKSVLLYDSSNIEAIACLASHHFYTDQPEIALRYFRRLLQMGVTNAELWSNLGLCCFYSSQYDMCLGCFDQALQVADDSSLADIWYNISQVAIGIGDLNLAYQCLKIAISIQPSHAEAYNNLGVLELRKGNETAALSFFRVGQKEGDHTFEPFYNGALLAYRSGDYQESFNLVNKALNAYSGHTDSQELLKNLKSNFNML